MPRMEMKEAQVLTLISATDHGPIRTDIAIEQQPLDPEDPRRPGYIVIYVDEGFVGGLGSERMANVLEAAAEAFRGARPTWIFGEAPG